MKLLIAITVAAAGAWAAFGSPIDLPTTTKPLGAGTVSKGATAQMQEAMASFIAAQPQYVQLQFDVDPHNGAYGYANLITFLQATTNNGATWTDYGSTWGQTNGFSVRLTGQFKLFRLRTPLWISK